MTNEELVKAIQEGENVKDNLEALYLQNMGIIKRYCKRYEEIEDPEDLKQEAFFAIRSAALMWDPGREAKFTTYAGYFIIQALQRYIDTCGGVVRVPGNQCARIRKYNRALNRYRLQFGKDPEPVELCALLDLTENELENLKKDIHALRIRSTSEPIGGEDEDIELEDTLPADGDCIEDLIDSIQAGELQRVLWGCVDLLEGKEGPILRSRYQDNKTLKSCSAQFGITKGMVKRIEEKALRRLRRDHSRALLPFYTMSGAYNAGFRATSLSSFMRSLTSSQERAMIQIEQETGASLYYG